MPVMSKGGGSNGDVRLRMSDDAVGTMTMVNAWDVEIATKKYYTYSEVRRSHMQGLITRLSRHLE